MKLLSCEMQESGLSAHFYKNIKPVFQLWYPKKVFSFRPRNILLSLLFWIKLPFLKKRVDSFSEEGRQSKEILYTTAYLICRV